MLKRFLNLINIQRICLAVGIFGVSFQSFVLNPMHNKISLQLNSLDNKVNKLEYNNNIDKIETINYLDITFLD